MKFSVSSYSYQQYINRGRMTQLDVVQKAADMGFAGIDFTDLTPVPNATFEEQLAYAKQIRQAAEQAGVEVVAYTIGANLYKGSREADDAEFDRLCKQLEIAAAMGATILRHDVCKSERVGDRTVGFLNMLPTMAENARRVTEYAKTLGIRTCTENHGFVAQDSDRVEALWNAVGNDNYGLLIDVGNFACADEDSAKAVSRLAPYAIHAHVKDFYVYPYGTEVPAGINTFSSRGCKLLAGSVIGEGNIPVEQCLAILKRAGYDGYLTVEYEAAEDCIAGIARGFRNLKAMVERI